MGPGLDAEPGPVRPPRPAEVWGQRLFFALFVRPFVLLFLGLRVRGLENLPGEDPFVLVANHTSHLDTVCLLSLFPLARLRRIRPVAAADYFGRNPFVSWASRRYFNILPIARQGITRANDPVGSMTAALESGQSLIVFPEGTRHSGGEMGPFRAGIAHVVQRRPGVTVVPAFLVNLGRALPKGQIIPLPLFCELRLGAPLRPAGSREEIRAAIEAAVRALREPAG